MDQELKCHILLEHPVSGVAYALQKGSGSFYETVKGDIANGQSILFNFSIRIKNADADLPDFGGPFVQGPKGSRFIYIDIGTYAGQKDSTWSRRLKIPLSHIDRKLMNAALKNGGLETIVEGVGKGGGPNCGTIKPFAGWKPRAAVKNN
jgi:hypothetical protein